MKKKYLSLVTCLILLSGCSPAQTSEAKSEIQVSAAVSLTESLKEIAIEFEKVNKDKLVFNLGGSGTLRKQIEEGAPCDLFISASKGEMDKLSTKDGISKDTRIDLLTNSIVLIGRAELNVPSDLKNVTSILSEDLVKSLAVGEPDAVPAGKYGMEALSKLNLTEKTKSKLIYTKDVRQALDYVESGNADAGIVYKTDAMRMKTGKIIIEFPKDSYTHVMYPAAITKKSKNKDAAQKFLDFLKTDISKKIFQKYGFTPI